MLFLFNNANANFFDYSKSQFAGEIGVISLGFGFINSDQSEYEFLYGLVPANYTESKPIETFAFKYNRGWFSYESLSFYTGAAIYHVIGLNYQTSRNGASPRNYYRLGSIRALFYYGLEYRHKKHALYFENGINDIWLTNSINNPEAINPTDYMSMALGYRHLF